jgi:hypothetical protein
MPKVPERKQSEVPRAPEKCGCDESVALRELAGELIDFCDLHAYGNGRVMGQSDVADDLLARAAALGVG